MPARTAFFTDERCFWHGGGNYAFTLPTGGLVQPGGGLPESPEAKRRMRNLMDVTGLLRELAVRSAPEASREELLRVHPAGYLDAFKAASDAGGGELGLRTPFGRGGYELAALSAGLATGALRAVLKGEAPNAYALCRPPGHHALPDFPNGFCLLNNIAVAIRAVQAEGLARRIAVIDWDVHHGNGTEAIFWEDPEVLTISIHQERNYPLDTGDAMARGAGRGHGFNVNLPLPPGAGHDSYVQVMDRIVLPLLARFRPEAIVVACGYDASGVDPLGRMLATAETFRDLTRMARAAAGALCGGRLVLVHEGGYSEVHVPFCGHAVIEELSGSAIRAPDPLAETLAARQPGPAARAFASAQIDALAALFLQDPETPMPAPSPAALEFLLTRRSRPAKTLAAPGPDREALTPLLTAALRVPDHGKLEPWRLIVLEGAALARLAALAGDLGAASGKPAEETAKGVSQFAESPLCVAVVAVPRPTDKVPAWEQALSAGCVCLSLLNAALAAGWGACWLTGWPAYDAAFLQGGLGLAPGERIAGFVHIGRETLAPPDRPRPDLAATVTWAAE